MSLPITVINHVYVKAKGFELHTLYDIIVVMLHIVLYLSLLQPWLCLLNKNTVYCVLCTVYRHQPEST